MDPETTPEVPAEITPAETTPTQTQEEVKAPADWLPEKVNENKEEVKDTQDPPKTDEDDEDKFLNDFLSSLLQGDTPVEEPVKEEDVKKDEDPFHNPNSEPEIFKKQIEAVTLERDTLKSEVEKSKDVLTLIETDTALKSFIQLVQKWTPAAKIFRDYLAAQLPPAPETTTTAKGAKAQEGNTAADLVRRMQARRVTRTKPV